MRNRARPYLSVTLPAVPFLFGVGLQVSGVTNISVSVAIFEVTAILAAAVAWSRWADWRATAVLVPRGAILDSIRRWNGLRVLQLWTISTEILAAILVLLVCNAGIVGFISLAEQKLEAKENYTTRLLAERDVLRDQMPPIKREIETLQGLIDFRNTMDKVIINPALRSMGTMLRMSAPLPPIALDSGYEQRSEEAHQIFVKLREQIKEYAQTHVADERLGNFRNNTYVAIWRLESRIRQFPSQPRWMDIQGDLPKQKLDLEARIDAYWEAVVIHSKAARFLYDEYAKRLADVNKAILDGSKQK
jgi:hypothetical protein